jgi:hypothetical protein
MSIAMEDFLSLRLWRAIATVVLLAFFAGTAPCSAQEVRDKDLLGSLHWWYDCR